jgi:hypothetical protein
MYNMPLAILHDQIIYPEDFATLELYITNTIGWIIKEDFQQGKCYKEQVKRIIDLFHYPSPMRRNSFFYLPLQVLDARVWSSISIEQYIYHLALRPGEFIVQATYIVHRLDCQPSYLHVYLNLGLLAYKVPSLQNQSMSVMVHSGYKQLKNSLKALRLPLPPPFPSTEVEEWCYRHQCLKFKTDLDQCLSAHCLKMKERLPPFYYTQYCELLEDKVGSKIKML